jgi:hypothetical protein
MKNCDRYWGRRDTESSNYPTRTVHANAALSRKRGAIMTSSKPTRKINYPTVDQVEELHGRILDLTGGEHGDLNRSNLEYLLEAVKEVGRKIETNQAIVKKAAVRLLDKYQSNRREYFFKLEADAERKPKAL